MIEEWKHVNDFENKYQVSDIGRIKNTMTGNILGTFINGSGYRQCRLYRNGKKYQPYLHKVVAEAFIPNLHNLPEVNHIDHNKDNCKVGNLEWCTRSENMIKYAEFSGTRKTEKHCIECGKQISHNSAMCKSCNAKLNNPSMKVDIGDRPSKDVLFELLKNNSFVKVGKMFGITDNGVRKWCKNYDIPYKSSYYKLL